MTARRSWPRPTNSAAPRCSLASSASSSPSSQRVEAARAAAQLAHVGGDRLGGVDGDARHRVLVVGASCRRSRRRRRACRGSRGRALLVVTSTQPACVRVERREARGVVERGHRAEHRFVFGAVQAEDLLRDEQAPGVELRGCSPSRRSPGSQSESRRPSQLNSGAKRDLEQRGRAAHASTARRARSAGAGCACRRSRSAARGSPRSSRGPPRPAAERRRGCRRCRPRAGGPRATGRRTAAGRSARAAGIVRDAIARIGGRRRRRRSAAPRARRASSPADAEIGRRRRSAGVASSAQPTRASSASTASEQRTRVPAALNQPPYHRVPQGSASRPRRAPARHDRCRSRPCGDRSATGCSGCRYWWPESSGVTDSSMPQW